MTTSCGSSRAEVVGALRLAAARAGADQELARLVADLTDASPAFRALWARRDVSAKSRGRKEFLHPEVGRLTLDWVRLELPGPGGHALMTYSAEPGTPAATALTLLATLAATSAAADRI